MDNENLGGEKAILEERRKKLDQLRDRGSAYGNSFLQKSNTLLSPTSPPRLGYF